MKETQPNDDSKQSTPIVSKAVFIWSLIAIVSFLLMFIAILLSDQWGGMRYVLTYCAVLSHLSLLPIVAALPAPVWSKAGGFAWSIFDTILVVASLHGISDSIVMPLRLGLHTVAAVWPLGVALTSTGFIRWAGYSLTITMGIVPLLGALVPPSTVFIVMPFVLIWLIAIALKFKNQIRNDP